MQKKADMVRRFRGSEVARAIVDAIEALPGDAEIIELKAGENMPITCSYILPATSSEPWPYDDYAWNGEAWHHIGWL